MNRKSRSSANELQSGQVWRMDDSHLQIDLVGKHLVHYRLIKGGTKRTPNSLSGRKAVESFLKRNKAVLVRRKLPAAQPVN